MKLYTVTVIAYVDGFTDDIDVFKHVYSSLEAAKAACEENAEEYHNGIYDEEEEDAKVAYAPLRWTQYGDRLFGDNGQQDDRTEYRISEVSVKE